MKVLFIIPTLDAGGIETYLLRFLKHIKSKLNSKVLVRSFDSGSLEKEYRSMGSEIVKMPLGYFSILKIYQCYKFIKTEKFNVVCDFNANFSGITMALAYLAGVEKRISFYRQASDHFKKNQRKRFYNYLMNRMVFWFATNILSNSFAALKYFFPQEWKNNNRFKVIYNGVNSENFNSRRDGVGLREKLDIPKDAFVIGHLGRLDVSKNHQTILEVFRKLQSEDSRFYLVIAGEKTESLQGKCNELGIKNVSLLGYRKDTADLLKIMDVFLFPSSTEGQPNALIEALMVGLPVATSNIESIREVVPEELHFLTIDPFDIEGYVKIILSFKNHGVPYNPKQISESIIKRFDYNERFDDFLSVLT